MKQMKRSLLLLVMLLGVLGTSAWGSTQWAVPAGFPGTANKVVTDAQGNVYVTGSTYSTVTDPATSTADILTVKYDSKGGKQWEVAYNGPYNGFDNGASLVLDQSGNIYVVGTSYDPNAGYTRGNATVVKYSPAGVQQWAVRYTDAWAGSGGSTIDVDAAGDVYITLTSIYDNIAYGYRIDGVIAKYDTNGNFKWKYALDFDRNYGDDSAGKVMVKNGFVYASGTLDGFYYGEGNYNRNSAVCKFTLDGQWLWTARHDGSGFDSAADFTVDGQDNVYIASVSDRLLTGSTIWDTYLYDMATAKFDANGQLVWSSRYNNTGAGNHLPTSIALDAAGNVYVTGNSDGDGTGSDIATIKYSNDGAQLWVDRYNGTANGNDSAGTVLVGKNGDVYVSGTSVNTATGSDFTAIKYKADGTRQWVSLYGNAADVNETATSAALDQNGDFILTGSGTDASGISQFLTVKFLDTINVAVDIKPGSFPNSINPRNNGVIPVAILSTDSFDAATVNPASVFFGATGTETKPNHYALEDVNGDGKADLMLQFPTQNTKIVCGTKTGVLTGATSLGQAIKGSDSITTTGCK